MSCAFPSKARLTSQRRIKSLYCSREVPKRKPTLRMAITAFGNDKKLFLVLAHQLAWASASFRKPVYCQLSFSDITFERIGSCRYQIALSKLRKVENTTRGCWHPLFENDVIAHGFPIPKRSTEVGLEIPFEAMCFLACMLQPIRVPRGIVLRGISATLVPVACTSDSVQWPLFASEKEPYEPPDQNIADQVAENANEYDLEMLKRARTFLGYCDVTRRC